MEQRKKETVLTLSAKKKAGMPITMVTAYDYTQARLVEAGQIDTILVGDSLGNVMLGYDTTIPVTLDDMVHHAKAVRRGAPDTMMIVDMPFITYHQTPADTVRNAGRLMQEAFADAVKLEGGHAIAPHVSALVQAGIPVCGHIGLTPQSVLQFGGFKVQGKEEKAAARLVDEALEIEQAGAFLLVIECVPTVVATEITKRLTIPTIGIGAGQDCDGQVLVFHDLLGFTMQKTAKFVKSYASLGSQAVDAIASYREEVKSRTFPNERYRYDDEVTGFRGES